MSRLRADLLLLVAALIWGLAFYFQKTAMSHIGPWLFTAVRAVIATLVLIPFALREAAMERGPLAPMVPISLLGGFAFLLGGGLQQAGIVDATIVNAGLLTALYVPLTPLVAWMWGGTRPSRIIWLAAILCFCGAWALGGGSLGQMSQGDMVIALSAVAWAVHIVITGKAGIHARPLTYTCIQFAVVAMCALGLAFLLETVSLPAILSVWPSLLYVGVLSSAVTFGIMAVALRYAQPSETAVLLSLETVFAALAGYVLLGERLTPLGWFGAALIFCSALGSQLYLASRHKAEDV